MSSSIIKEDLNEHFTFSKKNTFTNNEEDLIKSHELKKDSVFNYALDQTPENKNKLKIKPSKIITSFSNGNVDA